jgi:hypothetical protein
MDRKEKTEAGNRTFFQQLMPGIAIFRLYGKKACGTIGKI